MKKQMILHDLCSHRLLSVTTALFMALTSMLLGLSFFLFANLTHSIDSLMETARTPDFLQMHTGELDMERVTRFARERGEVEKMQICTLLNLPNSLLFLGENTLEGNMQDNGLCCQSPLFDYLLDGEDRLLYPSEGEVYVPICYRQSYGLKKGDLLRIGELELVVAGFLRDSQMNSMMASSKRFLVNEIDYERARPLGQEEYLIEFLLREGSSLSAFTTAYRQAALPGNGPTITYPLIRMINALSDGLMILVILLLSAALLFISILCIRYMILIQLEKDKRQIGILKALGLSRRDLFWLFFGKYLLLSALGALAGILGALLLAAPLGAQMRELYGQPMHSPLSYLLMGAWALGAEGMILLFVRRTLKRMDRLSAVEALQGRGSFGKRKNLWITILLTTLAAVFLLLFPWSLSTTLTDPRFVTYMGIGDSDIRMDIRQRKGLGEVSSQIDLALFEDERVEEYVLMQTASYKTLLPTGESTELLIENGDHGVFPVRYLEGTYPRRQGELALSDLNAQELGLGLGEEVTVCRERGEALEEEKIPCRICGIYSDITNGGKTAKACLLQEGEEIPLLWSIVYVSLFDKEQVGSWTREYQDRYAALGEGIKIHKISDYLEGTYGQVIQNIRLVSLIAAALACLTLFLVSFLILRLILWRERGEVSLKRALGFRARSLWLEYFQKVLGYVCAGIVLGILCVAAPGRLLSGALLSRWGARGVWLSLDPLLALVLVPSLAILFAMLGVYAGSREIKRIHAWECLGNVE